MPEAKLLDILRALPATPLIWSEIRRLHPAEYRQHVVPAPAAVAHPGPAIKVCGACTNVDHPVNRRRPARDAATRPCLDEPIAGRIRLGLVLPIVALVTNGVEQCRRDTGDVQLLALAARLRMD